MAELIIHQDKIPDNQELIKLCPFGAMEEKDGNVPSLREKRSEGRG